MRPNPESKNGRVADQHQFHRAGQKTTLARSGFHRAPPAVGAGQPKKDPVPVAVQALGVAPDPGTRHRSGVPRFAAPVWFYQPGARPKWPPPGSSPAPGLIVLHKLV